MDLRLEYVEGGVNVAVLRRDRLGTSPVLEGRMSPGQNVPSDNLFASELSPGQFYC